MVHVVSRSSVRRVVGSVIGGLGDIYYPYAISGLIFWLDGSSANNFVLNGSNVETWFDRSIYGSHVFQFTSSLQPLYTGNSVYFDGSGRRLVNSSFIVMNGLRDFTVVVLGEILLGGLTDQYFITTSGSLPNFHNFLVGTRPFLSENPLTFTYRGTPSSIGGEKFEGGDTSFGLGVIIYRRNYSGLRYSGIIEQVEEVIGIPSVSDEINNCLYLTVGAGTFTGNLNRFTNGYIRQILIYNRSLSDAEIIGLSNYLNIFR